jgi:hypothetical protein
LVFVAYVLLAQSRRGEKQTLEKGDAGNGDHWTFAGTRPKSDTR